MLKLRKAILTSPEFSRRLIWDMSHDDSEYVEKEKDRIEILLDESLDQVLENIELVKELTGEISQLELEAR